MPVAALTDRTSYPGYDLDNLVFDLDDPEFEDLGVKVLARDSGICGLSIRHSKSDSILQACKSFYSQWQECSLEVLPSLHQQHHRSVTFFCGGDCDSPADSAMLTIEELKSYNKSCVTCGVSWYEEHISLDCSECGGYAMERPCPLCDGQCSNVWRRDIDGSHSTHKAKWEGVCQMRKEGQPLPTRQQQKENDVLVNALDKLTTPL